MQRRLGCNILHADHATGPSHELISPADVNLVVESNGVTNPEQKKATALAAIIAYCTALQLVHIIPLG